MKIIFYITILLFANIALSQNKDSSWTVDVKKDTIYDASFLKGYTYRDPSVVNEIRWLTYKVKKVYPYARHAADIYFELEEDTKNIDSKYKIRRKAKKINEELEENFKFALRDLTRSEGRVLSTLIHYMTDATVYDIMVKYRGKVRADFWNSLSGMWDQDLKIEYDEEKHWILAIVLNRVENNEIKVADEAEAVTKEEYKAVKKQRKQKKKERHKRWKKREKEKKKAEKLKKKESRKK